MPGTSDLSSVARRVRSALIVVDLQCGFADASWGRRNNPACEKNVVRLIGAWRSERWPVVLVRHDSRLLGSPLAAGTPGNAIMAPVTQAAGTPDLLVTKQVNSAFYGTPDLGAWLDQLQIGSVTICGITTNHCCETTARMAGNLGYETSFVLDATHTFDRQGPDGAWMSADQLARATATNLQGEFASVLDTDHMIASLPSPTPGSRGPLAQGRN